MNRCSTGFKTSFLNIHQRLFLQVLLFFISEIEVIVLFLNSEKYVLEIKEKIFKPDGMFNLFIVEEVY